MSKLLHKRHITRALEDDPSSFQKFLDELGEGRAEIQNIFHSTATDGGDDYIIFDVIYTIKPKAKVNVSL